MEWERSNNKNNLYSWLTDIYIISFWMSIFWRKSSKKLKDNLKYSYHKNNRLFTNISQDIESFLEALDFGIIGNQTLINIDKDSLDIIA